MGVPGIERWKPIALELGDEEALLERAIDRLHGLEAGDVAVLPELVARSPERSEVAFAALHEVARAHGLGVVATLNLGPELLEDLPGRVNGARHHAVAIFTRHGAVHVPQAKVTPQSFERAEGPLGSGMGVQPYARVNRVRLDVGEALIEVRFLVSSDLWAFARLPAPALRADLLVVPGGFARGAESHAARLLERARAAGIAQATLLVNGDLAAGDSAREPLAVAAADLDEGEGAPSPGEWPAPDALADAFRTYPDERVADFAQMAAWPERDGRIALPRSLADAALVPGEYPVTIVL
jgi:hypothetical protein